ncbi:triggering receptor expressed on myeloid cells 1-like isoform X2 [Channa argus]|uniref:triggering receptor expressed on myeloid cells 1-like isoform X2 n=1 Tax=Channa argus TaxID=215402 RepID=UPI003520ACA6
MSVFEGGTLSSREVTSSWFDSEEGREAALSHQSLNMDVHHILICFFFLSLQDGNTGLTNAEITTRTGTEGGNITVGCSFSFSGSRKLFCKGGCTTGNILIETTSNRAQSGRYSIEYKEGFLQSHQTHMYVSITQLNKSDSGLYRCSLDRPWFRDPHNEFEIIVTEASTSSPPSTALQPSTTSRTFSSSSSFETYKQPETGSSVSLLVPLVPVLVVVVVVVVLVVVGLLLCKKKTNDSDGLNMRGISDQTNMEFSNYENCPPASTGQDSTYQSLSPVTRDQDQIYCSLTQKH